MLRSARLALLLAFALSAALLACSGLSAAEAAGEKDPTLGAPPATPAKPDEEGAKKAFDEGCAHFDKAVEHTKKGAAKDADKEYEEAFKAFQRATELDPAKIAYVEFLARAASATKRKAEALKLLDRAGTAYFSIGQFERAYGCFHSAFLMDSTNADYLLKLARAAAATNRHEHAITWYQNILEENRDLPAIKFELARSYVALNLLDEAKQELAEARDLLDKASPKNEQERKELEIAKKNVTAQLDAMEQAAKPSGNHVFSGMIGYTFGYDSNPAVKPVSDWVHNTTLGTIHLDNNNAHSDIYNAGLFALRHIYIFEGGEFAWKSDAIGYIQQYRRSKFEDQNLTYLSLKSGPGYKSGSWLATLQATGSYLAFNKVSALHSEQYLRTWGGEASMTYEAAEFLPLTFSVKHEKHKYLQFVDRDKDSYNTLYTFSPMLIWGDTLLGKDEQKNVVQLSPSFEENDADIRSESYDAKGISVRYTRMLPEGFSPYVGYSYRQTDYSRPPTLFLNKRHDKTDKYTVGLTKTFPYDISADLSFQHTFSDCNLDLYKYRRNGVTLTIIKAF